MTLRIPLCIILLSSLIISAGCKKRPTQALVLIKVKHLADYPSGSALAADSTHLYIIGDDANAVLVLNDSLEETTRILLFDSTLKRISKDEKADLESATMIQDKEGTKLLLLGSGGVIPNREVAWLINPASGERKEFKLDSFFQLLYSSKLEEINIEGMTRTPAGILLSNRGNKTYPRNYLVFTSADFWTNQARAPLRMVKVGYTIDTSSFNGVSGLDYSFRSDRLLLTVSTENTYNNYADGAIGKSYLWVIRDLSSKKKFSSAINPDQIIDLNEVDRAFRNHKIESVCILSETDKEMKLLLVSDDDNGSTTLFEVLLTK